ncbi:MAG: hypothetical protein NZ898_01910 [Myxococcota bacterium]|nr:hypothetical protein [Myxococcota bacterium]MDW8363055.1 hypothetical protein [Myxococcales bacterium]
MNLHIRAWVAATFVVGLGSSGCGGGEDRADGGDPIDGGTEGGVVLRCGAGDDPDGDFISSMDEGSSDADGDTQPNAEDRDSDGDGFEDIDEAGDRDCRTPPVDADGDGTPDFLDTDANGDGVLDREQRDRDRDRDGVPDTRDPDVDGDGIRNVDELGEGGARVDTDMDGTPDVEDDDSDGDSISDAHEGSRDVDGDGRPNFRDDDSDGDGLNDAIEAGDGELATPPSVCGEEIDPITRERAGDGFPDFADRDSDNDGLSDGEERSVGTDGCNVDSDGDGFDDLAEGAYERFACPDGRGTDCDCATSAACVIPDEHFYVVLPYRAEPIERDLDFGTTIRVADIFFISDTTGSMGGTLANVQRTVSAPGGLIDRFSEVIPDAWFGGGQHDDFPFGSYGGPGDEPFILAIRMTPPERRADVQAAFARMMIHGGGDGPESQTEALYQIVTGVGGTWMGPSGFGTSTYTMRRYAGDCLDSGWGAPCFRTGALPIIVHFTDICSHNGPPGEDTRSCDPYVGITPNPVDWTTMIAELNRVGAKYIGVNTISTSCAGVVAAGGHPPCYFMKRTTEETGSVDIDGRPLVYDLPNGSSSTTFVETLTEAIRTLATRVPLDVDTVTRDDPTDDYPASPIDATRFIKRRVPRCHAVPAEPCWTPPPGIAHEDAVAAFDVSTFFGVVPGSTVRFRIRFHNDFYPGGPTSEVYLAYIDVRGGGSAVLDTRLVIIVVPANPVPFG